MKLMIKIFLTLVISISFLHASSQTESVFKPKELYTSGNLTITQIAGNSFEHTSYKQTQDFGNVPCNGLIVRNNDEVIVFDTPTNNKSADELIKWIREVLHCKINAVIPTHFHDDCLGGLQAFDENKIPSYAHVKTIELAKQNKQAVPGNSFRDSLLLKVGNQYIIAKFFGEGHTKDNVVGYFPADNILFGGCLIKELQAGKGYLGDANTEAWPATVEKVKKGFADAKIIVPGHGAYGNRELLDYTIRLFSTP